MYQDAISHYKTMGDVDVVYHKGVYHLFHLVLPNHDFIAHAISYDGINWERVQNAIFIGDPGSWDDHMLWTMHVTRDPWKLNRWRMFYTGLSRQDGGNIQRLGCAYSKDLYHWEKAPDRWENCRSLETRQDAGPIHGPYDPSSPFPLEAAAPHYESRLDEGRSWVSFRDPFYLQADGEGHLVMAARTPDGPLIRRGCVGLFKEDRENQFVLVPPLHHPGQYDDIEVPNIFQLGGRYYLIGSIREDAKVRYWQSDSLRGPWTNYYTNVLLPKGNYAARVSFDRLGPMIWNFYTAGEDRKVRNLMPPPKRLAVLPDGRLAVKSLEAFDKLVKSTHDLQDLLPVARTVGNRYADLACESDGSLLLTSRGGFEGFLFSRPVQSFRLQATLSMEGLGKCGLLFRMCPHTSSGYHISLDLLKGIAELRAWGERPGGGRENAFQYGALQSGHWRVEGEGPWKIQLIGLQNYIEFSIDDHVELTLSDETYSQGRIGIYVESACVRLSDVKLEHLTDPQMPTDDLPAGARPTEGVSGDGIGGPAPRERIFPPPRPPETAEGGPRP